MISFGFWFAFGVCLFCLVAACAFKLGREIGKICLGILIFILAIKIIEVIFEGVTILLILAAIVAYIALIGYCIYKVYYQITTHKSYNNFENYILPAVCIVILLCGHFVLPFIIYGGMHIIHDYC